MYECVNADENMENASVYEFSNGTSQLIQEQTVRAAEPVTVIRRGEGVRRGIVGKDTRTFAGD